MLVDKQSELMSDLLFTVHQHGGDNVKWNPPIGHFTVMYGSKAEGDLVLIQTFFALLWKLFLKNTF